MLISLSKQKTVTSNSPFDITFQLPLWLFASPELFPIYVWWARTGCTASPRGQGSVTHPSGTHTGQGLCNTVIIS